jgi:uncharacterized protein (DUF2235 family)
MPKNIVLLSDGTGNSSAQLLKTNVWRIYESLDLDDPSCQVACYDDGVGTSGFKPLALFGGAVGFGLKKNVLRLYRFVCEHYDPGDRIYAFGFSRGAFTIRVLIGLIADQGIIRTRPTSPVVAAAYPDGDPAAAAAMAYESVSTVIRSEPQVFGSELARLSRWAYRDFRRNFKQTGRLVEVARWFRDGLFHLIEGKSERYDKSYSHQVDEIAFLGLWDTVDAYGLPMDELLDGVNKWVWPLSAPDLKLSSKVRKACHALAIDDERNTFHPVLWDESEETLADGAPVEQARHIDEERISQVWFAGMHANVGGGYPDDSLSYVSLRWIADEACKHGLKCTPDLLRYHTAKADPFGRIYDSRSGLKSYYRYNPRKIEWLTNGQVHERGFGGWPKTSPTVTIARPKIHESVFARIAAAPEAYAPIIFPNHYAIVREDGGLIEDHENPYEPDALRPLRSRAQERVWNFVWWRRVSYFANVAVTCGFIALPFVSPAVPAVTASDETFVSRIIGFARSIVPWIPQSWANYYSEHPWTFTGFIVAMLGLMKIGKSLQGSISGSMRAIWSQVIPPPGRDLESLVEPGDILYKFRSHPYYQGAFAVLRHYVLPTAFGWVVLLLSALWGFGLVNRAAFEVANGFGAICAGSGGSPVGDSVERHFSPDVACFDTGLSLEAGSRYRVRINVSAVDGFDPNQPAAGVRTTSPAGFSAVSPDLTVMQRLTFAAGIPFRRVIAEKWFVPMARIGAGGIDQYPIADGSTEFTARQSGQLFLFVNDAIFPIGPGGVGWTRASYANNAGTVTMTLARIPPPTVVN